MRTFALAAFLLLPALARAQSAPRSIALQSGAAVQSGGSAALVTPIALRAAWWIAERVDVTARVGWAFAARTEGRGADLVLEAGGGLRLALSERALRPFALADVSAVQVLAPEALGSEAGARLRTGGGIDWFFAPDLALGAEAMVGGTVLLSGRATLGAGLELHVEAYF
ncbi:MAG: hypothetical protein ACJ79R_11640 [Anaeromyxobacteraceae bacterium]